MSGYYQIVRDERSQSTQEYSLNLKQCNLLAGIFSVVVAFLSQLNRNMSLDAKIDDVTFFSVGSDTFTNALLWFTLIRSSLMGIVHMMLCQSTAQSTQYILFHSWHIYTECTVLFLMLLLVGRWGYSGAYC